MGSFFVVILRYVVPLEIVTAHRAEHLKFLDHYYEKKVFIASGRQIPPAGGIILARSESKEALEAILSQDPFALHRLAEYNVYEWDVSKYSEEFKTVLSF